MEYAARHRVQGCKLLVNPQGLPGEIGVVCAKDDPSMARILVVQTPKVRSVQCHDGAIGCSRVAEDKGIRVSLVPLAILNDRKDIVPKLAQPSDDLHRHVLIRV